MRKVTKISIPIAVMAGLIATGQAEDVNIQIRDDRQTDLGSPPRTEQRQSSERAEQQERLSEQQRQQQNEQRQRLTEQQRNQQSTFQPGEVSESQVQKAVTEVNKASSFIGMAVKNMQNQDLGKVNDLVFDPSNGRVSYSVLSIGGFLGVGDKLIAVPVTALKPKPGEDFLVLNMSKSQLESAPGLAQNNWPDLDAAGLGGPAGSESSSTTQSRSQSSPASSSSGSSQRSQGSSPSSSAGSSSSVESSSSTTSSRPDSATRSTGPETSSPDSGTAAQSESASSSSESKPAGSSGTEEPESGN